MPIGSKAEWFTLVEDMPKSLCHFLYWEYYPGANYDHMYLMESAKLFWIYTGVIDCYVLLALLMSRYVLLSQAQIPSATVFKDMFLYPLCTTVNYRGMNCPWVIMLISCSKWM